jgi:RNA polymerase sigma-70 factor (ECF subfamily)
LPGAGPVDLEDLAQQAADDALVAVLGKLVSFEGRSRFSTWVYKFGLLHAGVAVRRQAWRHREVPLIDALDPSDSTSTPEAAALAVDLQRAVRVAIATDLTPHQRRVTVALLVDQVPIDVLAERLNTNRNALYKTLHDARQHLRASLRASGHLDPTSSGSTS